MLSKIGKNDVILAKGRENHQKVPFPKNVLQKSLMNLKYNPPNNK